MYHHPMGKYWMKQADDWLSLIVRSIGYCQKCEKRGTYEQKSTTYTGGLHNHHLLEKSVYLAYRHLKMNCLCLCEICHSAVKTKDFREWFKENFRDQYEWMEDAKKTKSIIQINYKKIAEQLKAEYIKKMETNWMDLESQDVPPEVKI